MSRIDKIKGPISEEMKKFEPYYRKTMKSKVPLLDIITNYVLRRKGKQMRPMFVFLSAKLTGQVTEKTYIAATLVELLHTATLVHDDIVDESYERRGFWSINALWKNKIAVLVGDYFLSQGLLLSLKNKQYDILEITSEAVKQMSEGELLQIEKARKLDITEDLYFEIIGKKTASLIASCTACGAKSVEATEDTVNKMREFGHMAGIAFQIRDDLFDYEKSSLTGKPSGNDLKEKKMTLPLIYVLNNVEPKEKKRIIHIVKKHNRNRKKINEVIQYVRDNGGIEYARKQMFVYRDKALEILQSFPENEARNSLSEMVNYIADRKK